MRKRWLAAPLAALAALGGALALWESPDGESGTPPVVAESLGPARFLKAPSAAHSWLGVNLGETRDTAPGRWAANWSRFGRWWTRADGQRAIIGDDGYPVEASYSVVINGTWNYPPGQWALTWTPKTVEAALEGPGVVSLLDGTAGHRLYELAGKGKVRISTTGGLTSVGLWPPDVTGPLWWPGFFEPIDPLGIGVLRDLDIRATNYALEDAPEDSRRGWTPDWSKRARVRDCHWSTKLGIPIAVEAALANRLGVSHLWVTMPLFADEEYVQGVATTLLLYLDPSVVVVLEHSNEIWNRDFPQGKHYAALGGSDAPRLAGLDAARMFAWFADVFPAHRLWPVAMGHQSDVTWARRMAEAAIGEGADVRAIGCALYLPALPSVMREWKAQYRADETKPSFEDVIAALQRTLYERLPAQVDAHRALADDLDVELIFYEGGLSLYNPGPFGAVFLEVDGSEEAGDLLRQNFALAHGADAMLYAHFGYIGPPSGNMLLGSWNLMYDYATPTPKWEAFVDAVQD